MTAVLHAALKSLSVVREGYVVRELDGERKTDNQAEWAIRRIYTRAGLTVTKKPWHKLRHTFATHAAMLGVNPWRLQAWMGHKRIDETMLYVQLAGARMRPTPPELVQAGASESDPDARVLKQLGTRAKIVTTEAAEISKTAEVL